MKFVTKTRVPGLHEVKIAYSITFNGLDTVSAKAPKITESVLSVHFLILTFSSYSRFVL